MKTINFMLLRFDSRMLPRGIYLFPGSIHYTEHTSAGAADYALELRCSHSGERVTSHVHTSAEYALLQEIQSPSLIRLHRRELLYHMVAIIIIPARKKKNLLNII